MKCQHKWGTLAETTLPSAYEQMDKGHITFEKMSGISLFQKKYILVVFCGKCGKLKKMVESNPD